MKITVNNMEEAFEAAASMKGRVTFTPVNGKIQIIKEA